MKKIRLAVAICVTLVAMSAVDSRTAGAQEFSAKAKLPAGAKIIRVDDDRRQFRDAQFSYINNAIYAANPNDVIVVAPGIYREAVVVNKPLRIEGAQAGKQVTRARIASFNPATETVIVWGVNFLQLEPFDNTIISIKSPNVTLDGLTIQGENTIEDTANYRVGVGGEAVSNFNLLNSRIENTTVGVSFDSQNTVVFQGNAFLNNRTYTPTVGEVVPGAGIIAKESTIASVLYNVFAGNEGVALSLGTSEEEENNQNAEEPEEPEEPEQKVFVFRLLVSGNRFDSTLTGQSSGLNIELLNATSLTLTKNTIIGGRKAGIWLDAEDGPTTTYYNTISQNSISNVTGDEVNGVPLNGDGIYITNSLLKATIENNTISNNYRSGVVLAKIAKFINAFNTFRKNSVTGNGVSGFWLYSALGNNLTSNTISGNGFAVINGNPIKGPGVLVDESQDNQLNSNLIRNSAGDGIYVDVDASGNVFSRNRVETSGLGYFDIRDISIGNGTNGTANIYQNNKVTSTSF